jgi:hypothetical protein
LFYDNVLRDMMKLLTNSKEIENEFRRLLNYYHEYYWASAWAGVNFKCFDELRNNTKKITKIVIGTFFDQTHPEFIETFLENKNVKFVMHDAGIGTFHPKIYLFQNNERDWELLIGSMNFTSAGFSKNTEVLLLINANEDSDCIYDKALNLINKSWNDARYISEKELMKYKISWRNQQRRLGQYGENKPGKPIGRVEIMNLSWPKFVERVKIEDAHNLDGRLALLDAAEELFKKYRHFNSMTKSERKGIAGFLEGDHRNIEWLWFGSMKGSGVFKNKINSNDENISHALDKIPLEGDIMREHFENFIGEFKKTFPTGNWIATSSRLLAMKRPDVFVCFDSKNRKKLCNEFGIKQSNMTYRRYWEEIITRIFDSEWWKSPMPDNEEEAEIWKRRSAFLDAFYYEE